MCLLLEDLLVPLYIPRIQGRKSLCAIGDSGVITPWLSWKKMAALSIVVFHLSLDNSASHVRRRLEHSLLAGR